MRIMLHRKKITILISLCSEEIRGIIKNNPCIYPHIVEDLKGFVKFRIRMHHTYIHGKREPKNRWFTTMYIYSKYGIAQILQEWDLEWKTPMKEEE